MFKKIQDKNKGVIALILLAFVFASMGLFVRFLGTEFTLLQQTYLRVFAALTLGLILFYKDLDFKKLTKIPAKEWGVLVLRSVSLYLLAVPLVSQAIIDTKYSNASFIGALPVSAALGFILLKEKITKQKILYILIGFIGVTLIAVKDYNQLFVWGFGETLALLASFFFSLSYIARRWQSDLLNNKEIAVIIFAIASVLLLFTSVILFQEKVPNPFNFGLPIILAVLGAGFFNVLNLFLTNYGFQKVEAVLASNLLALEVLFAVVLGFLFYQEFPALKEFIGGILIVISVYQMNKITD